MTIFEFADAINKEIVIRYYPNQNDRFSASFERCEISEPNILIGVYGDGKSPAGAIDDYLNKIRGQKIVFNAHGNNRQEFTVPKKLTI